MLYSVPAFLRSHLFLFPTQNNQPGNFPATPHLGGIFEIFGGHQDTQVQKIEEFLRFFVKCMFPKIGLGPQNGW